MIRHIVMWKLLPTAEGRNAHENAGLMRTGLEGLVGVVPEIRSLTVNFNVLNNDSNWDVVLVSEFDDLAALARYQKNPDHLKVVPLVAAVAASRAAVDYEF